jgi:hypothetical protein
MLVRNEQYGLVVPIWLTNTLNILKLFSIKHFQGFLLILKIYIELNTKKIGHRWSLPLAIIDIINFIIFNYVPTFEVSMIKASCGVSQKG